MDNTKTYTEKQHDYRANLLPQLKKLKTDIYLLENIYASTNNEQLNTHINSIKLLISSIEYDIKYMHKLDNT